MINRLRMLYWRLRTNWRLLSLSERALWRATFRQHRALHNARNYVGHPEFSEIAWGTMAGYYNDYTTGGFMTPELAKKVYERD